jgi:uncharacterized protein (TIGR02679 family)
MSGVPPSLRDYLLAPSLRPLWTSLRERLERSGHAVRGSVSVPLDDDGADRLGGLLGRTMLAGETRVLDDSHPPVGLAELASEITGDAHGLDSGVCAALVLRALAIALDAAPAASAAERRHLWQRVGVSTDEISGTVITWALRPPGRDRWSAMMRERADLGLVTHLTVHELQRAGDLTRPGEIIHACENPQVLQRLAMADVEHPVACMSGNPPAAGMILLARTAVLYHGDFDWPGIAIARRIFDRGAHPWRFGRIDYLDAVDRLPADNRLGLSGPIQATPWDEALGATMMAADVAVHEELTVDMLLSDLQ